MIGLEPSYIIQIQQTTAVSSLCSKTLLRVPLAQAYSVNGGPSAVQAREVGAALLQILNIGNGSFLISASVRVTLAHPQELSSHMRMKLHPLV